MKKYIVIALMLCGVAYGQTPTFTPMRSFYEYKGIKMDSLFLLPAFSDTATANTARCKSIDGSLIKVGNEIFIRNIGHTAWVAFGKPDSPDRINGGANFDVVSDFNDLDWTIRNTGHYYWKNEGGKDVLYNHDDTLTLGEFGADQNSTYLRFVDSFSTTLAGRILYLNSPAILLNSGTFTGGGNQMLYVNNSGQIGVVPMPAPVPSTGNINLGGSGVTLTNWGVYNITLGDGAGGNQITLPSASTFAGYSITFFNLDGHEAAFAGTPELFEGTGGSPVTSIQPEKAMTIYSDGTRWRTTYKP